MENSLPPINNKENTENDPLKSQFEKDLVFLRGVYPEEVLTLVENNIDILFENYIAWQRALFIMAKKLNIKNTNTNEIPSIFEQITFNKVKDSLLRNKTKKIILGIAGPGAVGKETIEEALGFNTVVNTTTRAKRDYEKEDQHYHFVDDAQYKNILNQGGFVVSMKRPGRGYYGIQKKDIEKTLLKSKVVVVEENPVNLTELNSHLNTQANENLILVYVLPPSPILLHLAARLAGRCKKSGEDFKSAVISTLGTRQLDEFNSILDSINKNINVFFVVNDNVNRAVKKIEQLIEL